ncbi:MAG: outer membrane beta-barrel protein [Deltaproteobacteria bacterium]|nr:outer membrane beta-barrel protein [Deltaproteobacteria bacterium]
MQKKPLLILAALAVLVVLPVVVAAEMYTGLYIGGNFSADTDPRWEAKKIQGTEIPPPIPVRTFTANNISVDPAFVIGGKIGYWFSREGFLSFDYPDWMKYLGLEIALDYHNLDWPRQNVTINPINLRIPIENDGYMVTACFLLMGRYGFLPDKDVPFGRLQPYVGIGPAVVFTRTHLNIGRDYKSSEADLGFALETGVRYMVRKNISLSASFRYRYVRIHVDVDDQVFNIPFQPPYGGVYIPMYTTYNLFNILVGAAYHF